MKKSVVALIAIGIFMTSVIPALADSQKMKGKKTGYDFVYQIAIPEDLRDPSVVTVTTQGHWFCDDDEKVKVITEQIEYFASTKVEGVTKYNVGNSRLSGRDEKSLRFKDQTYHLSFDLSGSSGVWALVSFATQNCSEEFEQYSEGGKTYCSKPGSKINCEKIDFKLKGEYVLTIEPYSSVR